MITFNLFTRFKLATNLAFLVTLVPFSGAFASGGINGGGGKGVLCGDRLRVLDLYEAEQNKLSIPAPLGTTDAEIDRFGLPFLHHFFTSSLKGNEKEQILSSMKDSLNYLDSNKHPSPLLIKLERDLPFTNDATLPKLDPGCKFVQIAVNRIVKINNEEKTEVSINPDYWSMLDSINRVALFFHEFSYARVRSGYDLSDTERNRLISDETRKVIALILSGSKIPNIIGPVIDAKYKAWCGFGGGQAHGGNEEHFEIYIKEETKDSRTGLGFYFYGFKDRLVASQTDGFLPNFQLDQLLAKHFPSAPSKGPVEERTPSFEERTMIVRNEVMKKTWVVHIGTDVMGLYLHARDFDSPQEWPDPSGGFCNLEFE